MTCNDLNKSNYCGCLQIILCQPKGIYICDGTPEEGEEIAQKLVERGLLHPLKKYPNR